MYLIDANLSTKELELSSSIFLILSLFFFIVMFNEIIVPINP